MPLCLRYPCGSEGYLMLHLKNPQHGSYPLCRLSTPVNLSWLHLGRIMLLDAPPL